jgi:hypothetical protein
MGFVRANEGFRVDLEGIEFAMKGEHSGRIVVCLVTYEALTDAMGGDPTQEEQNAWYKENQGCVDGVAAAMLKADPSVEKLRVDTRNLNPDLFEIVPR